VALGAKGMYVQQRC